MTEEKLAPKALAPIVDELIAQGLKATSEGELDVAEALRCGPFKPGAILRGCPHEMRHTYARSEVRHGSGVSPLRSERDRRAPRGCGAAEWDDEPLRYGGGPGTRPESARNPPGSKGTPAGTVFI